MPTIAARRVLLPARVADPESIAFFGRAPEAIHRGQTGSSRRAVRERADSAVSVKVIPKAAGVAAPAAVVVVVVSEVFMDGGTQLEA